MERSDSTRWILLLTLLLGGCEDELLAVPHAEAGPVGAGGAAGAAPVPIGAGGAAGAEERALLIDDCDDGDAINALGGLWLSYDDYHDPNTGESVVWPTSWFKGGVFTMSQPGYGGDGFAARITGTTAPKLGYDYVGLAVALGPHSYCPDPQPAGLDVGSYAGVRFRAKGSATGGELTVKILHSKEGTEDNCQVNGLTGDSLTGWDDWAARFTDRLSTEWTEIALDFRRDFAGGGGSDLETVLDHAKDLHFFFQSTSGGTVDLTVDDVELYGEAPTGPVEARPDMELLAAAPPERVELPSLVVDHPLQALAMESLDRGYNVTNWLEQGAFAGFEYDEDFVARVAAAGHRALRLPIDLDRYVTNYAAYAAGEAALELDPTLFTILDAFDQWTLAHGLSLTIDYHQYDASCDLSDPVYVEAVAEIWGRVAEHFAAAGRRDLFFELLNEVEQSTGSDRVAAEDLTAFATRLLAAIREFDPTRVVLFGDVQWYGITPLTSREPFDDENVIYVFHFYEPFIFTHQGTSWTDLEPVHDVPYPYSPERWFERFADLGFDPDVMPAWVIDRAEAYYRQGNRNALYNEIARAKRWAGEHAVPVICNEFGAYDGGASTADRAAYYSDLVGVFEELEIPWTHWFMVMDRDTGAIDPAIAAAMGLTTEQAER